MKQFIIVVLFLILGFTGMALALYFSKYKQRNSGCCGGGHCEIPDNPAKTHERCC